MSTHAISTARGTAKPTKITSIKAEGPAVTQIRPPQVWLRAEQVAALKPSDVVEAVTALQPLIAKYARATEEGRRPHPEVWDALAQAGVFYHFVPRKFGGCEFGLQEFIDAMLPIGEVCGSTCWTATFTVEHNLLAALFPERGQEELFARGYCSAPGVSSPIGVARRETGGFRVSGHYRWGSGVMNADWILTMALIEGDETMVPHWFALPASEVTVLDTWHVDGMAGTGSNDIVAQDVFVPEHRMFNWLDAVAGNAPGASVNDNPIYRVTPVQFLTLCTTIPIVAAARGLVKQHCERMSDGRMRFGSTVRMADKSSAQVRVAKADLLTHSAELVLRDVADRLMQAAVSGGASDSERVRQIAQCAHASSLARKAAQTIAGGAGASIHALSNPMQRLMRDIQVASSHQMHEFDEVGEQYGKALFGIGPDSAMR